jgi:hypothetical protein
MGMKTSSGAPNPTEPVACPREAPLLPNAIKAAWAQLHILRRVADCLVSQVELDFAQVAAFISECEPGSMPQLVGVHIWQPGFGAHTL